jgi:3'(2'), 5'-bisphosphate nucleotidase
MAPEVEAGMPGSSAPPWLDDVPAPLRPAALAEFVRAFRALSASLAAAQRHALSHPAGLAGLEWDLEKQLIALIRQAFGSAAILAEEHFKRYGSEIDGRGRVRFALDPLDGSASYLRGSDCYATSLSAYLDSRPVFALIYSPAGDTLYSACAGHGSWKEDRLLRWQRAADRVMVVKKQWIGRVPEFAQRVEQLRRCGYQLERMESTSLKLCWLAEGKRAGLIKWLSLSRGVVLDWGTSAGLLICSELGLRARRLDGRPWAGTDGGLLVGDRQCLADLGYGGRPAG